MGYVNVIKVTFRPIKRSKFMGSMFPGRSAKLVCSLLRKYPIVSKMLLVSPFRTYRGPNDGGNSSTRKGERDVECRRGKKALCRVSHENSYLNRKPSISLFVTTKPCSERSSAQASSVFSRPILKNPRSPMK